jgi:hypothetical protein
MQSPAKTDTVPSPEENNTEAERHDTLASSAFQRLEPLQITSATMPLPQDPDVTCGSLACGLRYYIKKNQKPEQRVALRLAVRVGSLQEEEAERGIAHMVEHLAFRATTNYDKLELVEYLESIGAAFGACQNAYTSFDETVYMLSVPSDGKDLVKQSIQVCFLGGRGHTTASLPPSHAPWPLRLYFACSAKLNVFAAPGASRVGLPHPHLGRGRRGGARHRVRGVARRTKCALRASSTLEHAWPRNTHPSPPGLTRACAWRLPSGSLGWPNGGGLLEVCGAYANRPGGCDPRGEWRTRARAVRAALPAEPDGSRDRGRL